ncbi:MAG: hypothetical protein P8X90_15020 [Desulfobacterales bacterium]
MAHNFKMIIHRRTDKLTIRLAGDFDGSSAWELIHAIRENLNNLKFVKIDTGELKMVYPFGREVFRNNISHVKNTQIRMQFSGPNALQIDPPDTN